MVVALAGVVALTAVAALAMVAALAVVVTLAVVAAAAATNDDIREITRIDCHDVRALRSHDRELRMSCIEGRHER